MIFTKSYRYGKIFVQKSFLNTNPMVRFDEQNICQENSNEKVNVLSFEENDQITLRIGYSIETPDPTTISSISLTKSSLPINSSTTLKWTTANSNWDYFEVQRRVNSGSWETKFSTPEDTSIPVDSSNTSGDIYEYRVRARYYDSWGSWSSIVKLTTLLTTAGAPTDLKVDDTSSPFYVANPGSLTYTLTWKKPSSVGDNNSITGYKIYRSTSSSSKGSEIGTAKTSDLSYPVSPYPNAGGSYYYYVLPVNSNEDAGACTSYSSAFQITTVAEPTPASITSVGTTSNTVNSNFKVDWSSATSITGATSTYLLEIQDISGNRLSISNEEITGTTTTANISSITNGSQFKLCLWTMTRGNNEANAMWVGKTTYSTTFTKGSNLSFSNSVITITNDNGDTAALAYAKVTLTWSEATSSASGATVTYSIRYKTSSNTAWSSLSGASGLTTTSYEITNFATIAPNGGDVVTFKIIAEDSYGATIESSVGTITKMYLPVIENLQIAGTITNTSVPYSFNYINKNSNDSLKCTISLGYNNLYNSGLDNISTLSNQANTIADTLIFNIANGSGLATTTMLGALYDKVIINKYPKPAGTLRVILESTTISACKITATINFNYNFITPLTSGTLTAGGNDFYNPGDEIPLSFTAAKWTDAAGGTAGGTLSYYITGNNHKLSNLSAGTSYTDTAPEARKDIAISYTLVCTVTYADGTSISTNSNSGNIYIARWSDSDTPYLSQVTKTETTSDSVTTTTIKGSLIMPELFCGSSSYSNFNSAIYILYYEDGTATPISGIVPSRTNIEIPFSFSTTNDLPDTINLYAKVIFKNTSLDTIEKTTALYTIRAPGVTMALRKGRVGINVDSQNFTVSDTSAENSALYVVGTSTAAPVVEILTETEGTELITFHQGANEIGRIVRRDSNNAAIDIEGYVHTEELTLTIETWVDTTDPKIDDVNSISGTYPVYTISNNYITATTVQEIIPRPQSLQQLKNFQKANIVGGEQGNGYCTLICCGTKPTNIPITMIIRGG